MSSRKIGKHDRRLSAYPVYERWEAIGWSVALVVASVATAVGADAAFSGDGRPEVVVEVVQPAQQPGPVRPTAREVALQDCD
ncbi:MAG: hypothetical protein ACRCY9_01315, partial [Phycicoccus sp.]